MVIKGAPDKYNIISNFFQKQKWDFHTITGDGMGKDV